MTATDSQLREDMIINATLMACNALNVAEKLRNVNGIRYSADGRNWSSRPENGDSLSHIEINLGGTPERIRYFERMNTVANGAHGFSASAWVETDPQGEVPSGSRPELRILFNGYGVEDTAEAARMIAHQSDSSLNRQIESVPRFIDDTMNALRDHDPAIQVARDIEIMGHSIGASSAIYARLYLEQNARYRDDRYTADVTLLEPWMESTDQIARESSERNSVLSNALWGEGQNSRYSQSQLRRMMNDETVNVDLTHDGIPYTFVNLFPSTNVGTSARIERDDVGLGGIVHDRSIASLVAAQGQHALASIIPYLRANPDSVHGLDPLPTLPFDRSYEDRSNTVLPQSLPTLPQATYRVHAGDGLSHLMQAAGFSNPNDRYYQAMFATELRRLNPNFPVGDADVGYALGASNIEVVLPSAVVVTLSASLAAPGPDRTVFSAGRTGISTGLEL